MSRFGRQCRYSRDNKPTHMLINKETLFGDSTERKVQRENMLLIHLLKALSFQWLWAMVIVLLLVRTWRVNLIAFLDTFPSSDLRDMRNVSERFQYSGPLNYCYICYVRVQYRLISMQPKELQMIHDGGKKIVVFNSGKMKKISKCNSSRHVGNQRRIKNFVYEYAYVWAKIQGFVQLS